MWADHRFESCLIDSRSTRREQSVVGVCGNWGVPCPLDVLYRVEWLYRIGHVKPTCLRDAYCLVSTPASDDDRVTSWSGSVAAAEARKAKGANMHALLTPRPPMWTGSDACFR